MIMLGWSLRTRSFRSRTSSVNERNGLSLFSSYGERVITNPSELSKPRYLLSRESRIQSTIVAITNGRRSQESLCSQENATSLGTFRNWLNRISNCYYHLLFLSFHVEKSKRVRLSSISTLRTNVPSGNIILENSIYLKQFLTNLFDRHSII